MAASPTHPKKGGADWLGLKDEDLFPPSPTREAQRGGEARSTPSAPPPRSQHSAPAGLPTSSPGAKPAPEGAGFPAKAGQPSQLGASKEKEEEDWLSYALYRKKSRGLAREEHTEASRGQNLVGAAGSPPSSRYRLGLLPSGGRAGRWGGGGGVQPCPCQRLGHECQPTSPLSCASLLPWVRQRERPAPRSCPGADMRGPGGR